MPTLAPGLVETDGDEPVGRPHDRVEVTHALRRDDGEVPVALRPSEPRLALAVVPLAERIEALVDRVHLTEGAQVDLDPPVVALAVDHDDGSDQLFVLLPALLARLAQVGTFRVGATRSAAGSIL